MEPYLFRIMSVSQPWMLLLTGALTPKGAMASDHTPALHMSSREDLMGSSTGGSATG